MVDFIAPCILLIWGIVVIFLNTQLSDQCSNSLKIWIGSMGGVIIFLALLIGACRIWQNVYYNKIINTPNEIEIMKQEIRTDQEKEIVNDKIKDYNETISRFLLENIGRKRLSELESQVYQLTPIEELP